MEHMCKEIEKKKLELTSYMFLLCQFLHMIGGFDNCHIKILDEKLGKRMVVIQEIPTEN